MRGNAFDLMRLVAAGLVLYGHSFRVVGLEDPGLFAGDTASFGVAIFFATSGYLISSSWHADPRLGVFIWKRCLRILPALAPLAIVLALIAHGGFFDGNPRSDIDPPLWTLPVEARCYLLVAALGALGALRRPTATLSVYAALVLIFAWSRRTEMFSTIQAIGSTLTPKGGTFQFAAVMQLAAFAGGMLMHYVPRRRALASLALVVLIVRPGFAGWVLAMPYLVVYIGESFTARLRHDVSYGLYIWGWPVQQAIVALGVAAPLAIFPLAVAVGAVVGFASWAAVERPALRLKPLLDARLSFSG